MRSADIQAAGSHGKRLFRKFLRGISYALILTLFGRFGWVRAEEIVGTVFPVIEARGVVYRDAKVLSVTAATVTIRHAGGIVQLPLRGLAPELQQRFGYDPESEAFELRMIENERRMAQQAAERAETAARATAAAKPRYADTPIGRALSRFGTRASVHPEGVDLRPRFRELDLGTKNQGLRPSCAVFAVVCALEYESAELPTESGKPERLSEEYLIWATRRILGIPAGEKRQVEIEGEETSDAGFRLQEVLSALRAYGIPGQKEMPNTFGLGMEKIPDPGDEVIASARGRRQVSTYAVSGVNNAVKIANIVHVLNEGVPVVVGLRWPHWRTLRQTPLLSQQTPLEGRSHAVTIVGYVLADDASHALRFIFRNSWGVKWGVGGYGFVDATYLEHNLLDAVVLEVRSTGG